MCWLADLNTTVGGLVRCAACVCDIVFGTWECRDCGRVLFFCWDMQTVGAWRWTCWLADLNTTVGGHARCAACVCHIGKWAPGMARFVWGMFLDWESATASPDWVND